MKLTASWLLLWLSLVPRMLGAQYECHGLPDIPVDDVTIRGSVTSADHGRPVPQIFISVDNAPLGMTDCKGKYSLSLDPGTYLLTTYSAYFYPDSQRVTVAGGSLPLTIDFHPRLRPPALPPSRPLTGRWDLLMGRSEHDASLRLAAELAIGKGKQTRLATEYTGTHLLKGGALELLMIESGDRMQPQVPVSAMADTIEIWLTPGTYDAGYSIRGFLAGDSILGNLCEHNFAHDCVPRLPVLLRPHR